MATIDELLDTKKQYDRQANPNNQGYAAAGVTAVEMGDDVNHVVKLHINTTLGAIAGGAALALGKQIYTLPAGAVLVEASHLEVAITQTEGNINADTPVIGLGTVVASGAVAVLSGTATFINIMAGQTAANCTGTPTVKTVDTHLVREVADAHAVFLNVAATWATDGDVAAKLTGTVTLAYKIMK